MIIAIIIWIPIIVGCAYLLNRFYFNGPMCRSKKRLDGKVVCITGANCGIGYETALDLANRGATVILACRDLNKAYKAQHQILIATKNPNVFAEKLDLASLASIKDFADMFANRYKQLHILINNAGLLSVQREKTADGFELNFGVMHLGHFYLTNLLLDLMKSSAPARIINVSSVGHIGVNMQWDDLQLVNCKYDALYFYRHAKLANVLFTVELAERLKDSNITAVSLHPGGVHTDIFRQVRQGNIDLWSIVYLLITPVFWVTGKDCKHGAQTSIHCAVDDNVPSQNGKYFDNCKVGYCSWQSRDAQAAKRLWDISAKLVGLK